MTEVIFGVAMTAILALHVWTVYQHKQERKDLLTRIMARDLTEYLAATSSRPPPKSSNPIRGNIARHFEAVEDNVRNS